MKMPWLAKLPGARRGYYFSDVRRQPASTCSRMPKYDLTPHHALTRTYLCGASADGGVNETWTAMRQALQG
jgi:hypothetical protein